MEKFGSGVNIPDPHHCSRPGEETLHDAGAQAHDCTNKEPARTGSLFAKPEQNINLIFKLILRKFQGFGSAWISTDKNENFNRYGFKQWHFLLINFCN
jgi:hypothetical protein